MNGKFRVKKGENGNNPQSEIINLPTARTPQAEPELPGGQVPLDSPFYIDRPPIEERSCEEIRNAGALIRIKAPARCGKTSLMSRILATAREYGCRTVTLNLQLAAASVFTDLDRFLQWFCASTGKSLGLANRVTDYWDEIFGSNYNCTDYFENYLLVASDSPLVLALDDADRVFQYPEIASEFFGLLRAWYEKAKYGDSGSPSFEKLRLVVVHSTEVYIPLNFNQSPFNVGLSIDLPSLNEFQVQDLALRHGLEISMSQIDQLMSLVAGNPYLLRVAMYHIRRRDITFEQLLQTAATEGGIYKDHLCRQWRHLQQYPELAAAFELVITSDVPVELDSKLGFKLQSMGLINLWGGEVTPSCDLYRQYFRRPPSQWKQLSDRIAKLERDNQELQQLVKVDSLTQLANRRCFDEYLNLEWRRLAQVGRPLSLILCDIDFFKAYNDTYGHPAGDECLQKVAKAIATALRLPDDLAARYGGEEFALILPDNSVEGALLTAEIIRANVKALRIPHSNSGVGYFLTLSVGVSSIIPSPESSPAIIVRVADQALYEAKAQGRDRTILKIC